MRNGVRNVSFLGTYFLIALFSLFNTVNCSSEDAWDKATLLRERLPIPDDLRRSNVFEYDPFGDSVEEGISIIIPMDYYESERERAYSSFWNKTANGVQKEYFALLQEATQTGSHKSDAHWELKEMSLYGKYCFPHNKTQAYHHLEQFNRITKGTNSTALFELSVMYSTGLFGTIPKDIPKALLLLQESANLDNIRAKQALAYRYYEGLNVERDKSKALLIYAELADKLRAKYTSEEWDIRPPYVESYNLRIPDLGDGLVGVNSGLQSSAKRLRKRKPKSVESFLPDDQKLILQFGDDLTSIHFDTDDNVETDRISDIYYAALNSYYGTYTLARDPATSASILLMAYHKYADQALSMEILSKVYFAKCVELLGHQYFRGEGVELNIELAEKYLNESNKIIADFGPKAAHVDLGLIAQYYKNDPESALKLYSESAYPQDRTIDYQIFKLINNGLVAEDSEEKAIKHLKRAASSNYLPACYELAKQLEQGATTDVSGFHATSYEQEKGSHIGANDQLAEYGIVRSYKDFVDLNEQHLAYYLKDAFLSLLRQESETALWYYAMAAEQGYLGAQVSAAWLLYQPPRLFEKPPIIPEVRRDMALHYYMLAGIQGFCDAKVVAGNIFFEMGEYEKSIEQYAKCHHSADFNMGYMYEHGLGVEKDYHLAKSYYENFSFVTPPITAFLPLLKLRIHWAISWVSKNVFRLDTSNFASWFREKWNSWAATERKTTPQKISKGVVPENKYINPASWYRKTVNFIKAIDIEVNEEVLMIAITFAIIFISFVISFLRGNMNIRVNGIQIGRNDNDGLRDNPLARPEGDFNIMFFAI